LGKWRVKKGEVGGVGEVAEVGEVGGVGEVGEKSIVKGQNLTPQCLYLFYSPTRDNNIPYTVDRGGTGYVSAYSLAGDWRKHAMGTGFWM
jgi:hypothetical protein